MIQPSSLAHVRLVGPQRGLHRQRGVALFVVIVFVLLSMLLALWASRTSMFNELVVGNDADYQRAFEAAQALMQDAELDIRGEKANGTVCTPDVTDGNICRRTSPDQIPLEAQEVGLLLSHLQGQSSHCRNGMCVKRVGRQDFWNYAGGTINPPADAALGEVPLANLTTGGVGARYGQFTGALLGAAGTANPILADRSADDRGGWYWIEVLPYDESSKSSGLIIGGNTNLVALSLTPSVVYRITTLAYGRKTNAAGDPQTMVVLQETYAPQRRKD